MGRPTTMLGIWAELTFKGKYVSWSAWFFTFLPFLILVGIVLAIVVPKK
jgi:hypothetical protein